MLLGMTAEQNPDDGLTPGQRRLATANAKRRADADEKHATRLREHGWTVIPPRKPTHDQRPAEGYGERKPYTVADRLDDLTGPTSGVVRLPHHINWSGTSVHDLDQPGMLASVYQTVLSEASTQSDLAALLNQDALIRLWPDLYLPAKVRRLWESRFPQLPASPRT